MNQKGFLPLAIILGILIVSTGIIGVSFYLKDNKQPPISENNSAITSTINKNDRTSPNTWDKQVISYSSDEVEDILLDSVKDFSSQGDPLSYRELFAEKCAPIIAKYIYAFPGFRYGEFVSNLGFNQYPHDYPVRKEGNHYIILEANGDARYSKPKKPGESFDDIYNFQLDFNESEQSCNLVHYDGASRSFLPKEASDFALKIALQNQQIENNLKAGKYSTSFGPWMNEDSTDFFAEGAFDYFKSVNNKYWVIPIYFNINDQDEFTAFVDVASGQIFVTPLQPISRPVHTI